jgi:hypothetical protein
MTQPIEQLQSETAGFVSFTDIGRARTGGFYLRRGASQVDSGRPDAVAVFCRVYARKYTLLFSEERTNALFGDNVRPISFPIDFANNDWYPLPVDARATA